MGVCPPKTQEPTASRTGRDKQRYDEMGRRLVVGCVPYKYEDNEIKVLVISAQKKKKTWYLPKGGWENDEQTAQVAVKREAQEEAGVTGDVELELGWWEYQNKQNTTCKVHMFGLKFTQNVDWPEETKRKRKWVSVTDARDAVKHHKWMQEALDNFDRNYNKGQANYDNNQNNFQGHGNYLNNQTLQGEYNYDTLWLL